MVSISVVVSALQHGIAPDPSLCSAGEETRACRARPPSSTPTCSPAAARARPRLGPADFLHEAVAGEVAERLSEVNRTLSRPGDRRPARRALGRGAGRRPASPAPRRSPTPRCSTLEPGAHDLVVHAPGAALGERPGRPAGAGAPGAAARRALPRARSSAARRCTSCAPRSPRPRSRRSAASARGWRRWARSATSAACCSARASRCRSPTAAAST